MTTDQPLDVWSQIVARSWRDAAFKKRLLASPAMVLDEHGVNVAQGIEIRIVENTDRVLHLTLPAAPHRDELSDADLAGVAGGVVSQTLLNNLTSVFGWSARQISQILDARDGNRPSGGGGGPYSSDGGGADEGGE